ncbi:DNA polymerase III subunit chi [Marinicauda pacifica]|uniref:DNA polymerase III subunit chi n=1 Tax=Marinicauda pacifica TaxID=1133559 RepID=A0A4S2HFT8_9PROT|nr:MULTISPECIES: DNA polymerase III subunit chi [Marinicauda]TGY94701.1 DNA polymerase III subunit chi [Marinicauda pacifica]GGE38043.1 DNA polymerase III subunit chi [Marinicauda pacifica]
MAELWFYHLEQASVDEALPELLTKLLARGGRAVVASQDEARLEALDAHLWTFRDDAFLPHGRDSEPQASRQPVLLSTETRNVNGASMLFLLDATPIEIETLADWDRVVVMFEARDEGGVSWARELWSAARKGDAEVSYWRQNDQGRWEKKA